MKKIALLGSTGSIGTQALDIIERNPDRFSVEALVCGSRVDDLCAQIEKFRPHLAAVAGEKDAKKLKERFPDLDVCWGEEGLITAATCDCDIVFNSLMGMRGLAPTYEAILAGKTIALANKETLVAGGDLIMKTAAEKGVSILPVDSEHSAIFQCMLGQDKKHIHKLLLTASGGPFRGKTREELRHVTVADAMKHPTWNMGMKVTLDSATMFNKGLEVIEAHWLFGVDYDDIEVIVQPQSLIHSMVEYDDGSIMAQIGNPDMRLPIQFALTYPERLPSPSGQYVNWRDIASIIIEKPDLDVFRSLKMAYEAGKEGGSAGTAFNAANEEAIRAFIAGKLSFLSIYDVVEETLSHFISGPVRSYEDIMEADRMARNLARNEIERISLC